jgi:putative membrane protein
VERAPGGRLVTACAAALVLLGLAALAVVLTGAV